MVMAGSPEGKKWGSHYQEGKYGVKKCIKVGNSVGTKSREGIIPAPTLD